MIVNSIRGMPGMFGSIDVMQMSWKNAPHQWSVSHTNGFKCKNPSFMLEVIATVNFHL